jgi:hypothetical protein
VVAFSLARSARSPRAIPAVLSVTLQVMHLAATELPSGFWSYVHKDNDAEHGRILRLCDALKDEFGLLTTRDLDLFTDRDGISWGFKWRATIDNALNETTFFIAIVTPRYVVSKECRRELLIFSQNAQALGVPELLCPILYAEVDGLDEDSEDEVKAAIAQAQWVPFTELRLVDEQSPEYRQAINELARRLIDIANTVARREAEAPTLHVDSGALPPSEGAAAEPPFLDAMAAMEELFPEWQKTVQRFSELMIKTGEITNDFTPKVTEAAKEGPVAAYNVMKEYASALQPVAEEYRDTGTRYVEQAVSMSENIVAILNWISKSPKGTPIADPTLVFLQGMISAVEAGQQAMPSLQDFQHTVQQNYGLSRVIRPPLELLSEGTQRFLDGQALLDDWKVRIDEILADHPPQEGTASGNGHGVPPKDS